MSQELKSLVPDGIAIGEEENYADRRQNYRIAVDDFETPVRAELTLQDGTVTSVEIVNYSLAGLLFYADFRLKLKINDYIPKICLEFRRKPEVHFAGEIVRLEHGEDKAFCGIRFVEKRAKEKAKSKPARPKPTDDIPDEIKLKWSKKLRSLSNYMRIDNLEEQMKAEEAAYGAFKAVTDKLNMEERWWFFEMLDELKRKEPFYPPRLLQEFVMICEWGYTSIPARPMWHKPGIKIFEKLKRMFSWLGFLWKSLFSAA